MISATLHQPPVVWGKGVNTSERSAETMMPTSHSCPICLRADFQPGGCLEHLFHEQCRYIDGQPEDRARGCTPESVKSVSRRPNKAQCSKICNAFVKRPQKCKDGTCILQTVDPRHLRRILVTARGVCGAQVRSQPMNGGAVEMRFTRVCEMMNTIAVTRGTLERHHQPVHRGSHTLP